MNAAQITHIFWKEYRTQRGLWVGLVGFCLLFQVIVKLSLRGDHAGDFEFMMTVSLLTVVFYTLASTSILYASEKEQRTDTLLRIYPTNKWLVWSVKVSWVFLSSLLAMTLFTLTAFLLGSDVQLSFSGEEFLVPALLLAIVFSCTLVASMLSRHVLSAIGISLALMIALVVFGEVVVEKLFSRHDQFWLRYMTIVAFLLVAVSLELNRRWFRDRDFSWRWTFRLNRAMTLSAAVAEAEYSGTWRRHVWREWDAARIWLSGLAVLSLYVAITAMQGRYGDGTRFIHFAVNMCLVPFLAGVASCRGDQTRERFRFLGNRGVSAAQVLCVKHCVWLGGCALILIFVGLYAWASPRFIESHRQDDFTGSLELIPVSVGLLSSARVEQLSQSLIPGIVFWGSVSLLLYSLGHFLSLLLAQPILALMVSFMLSIFAMFVVVFYYALDVPLFILTIVPAACLLSLSFYRGEDWLAGRKSARDWRSFCLFAGLGLWTIVTLLASWRVLEIPWSTTIDTSGLYNLPAWYAFGCFLGLVALAGMFWFVDLCRATFRDRAGRPLFVPRRWCTFGTIVVSFLIAHNLLGLAILRGYDAILSRGDDEPTNAVVLEDLQREALSSFHQKHQPEFLEWSIKSRPFPVPADVQSDRSGGKNEPALTQWPSWEDVTEEQRLWLSNHQHELKTFFELDQAGVVNSTRLHPTPLPRDPAVVLKYVTYRPLSFFEGSRQMLLLVRLEALRLEHEGRLAEAWKHHLAVIRYARRFADHNFPVVRWEVLNWLNEVMLQGDLWRWQARREQTPELLARAARELHAELATLSPLAEAFQRDAGWSLLYLDNLSSPELIVEESLAAAMPWEKHRMRSLMLEQSRLVIQLAEQIDRGEVGLVRDSHPGYSVTYNFDVIYHDSVAGKPYSVYLDVNRRSGAHDLRMSAIHSASRPSPPESRSKRLWYRGGPPSKIETTIVAPDMRRRSSAIVDTPSYTSALGIVNQRLTGILLSEIDFWNSLRWSLSRFPIYAFRAETGHFPADLNRLRDTRTSEAFRTVLPDIAFALPEIEIDQLSKLASVVNTNQGLDPAITDYTWLHAGKWPQPEYNVGETPDRKPAAPLQAPKPEEVQP